MIRLSRALNALVSRSFMKLGGFPERIWRGRVWRALFLAAALLLLATITPPGPPPPPPGPGGAAIAVAPVPLDSGRSRPPPRRGAALPRRLVAGQRGRPLRRHFRRCMSKTGEVIAVSDVGMVMRFPAAGRARRLPVRFDPLVEGPGPRSRKSNRDTEALLVGGDAAVGRRSSATTWSGATTAHRSAPNRAARPAAMRRWGGNRGRRGAGRGSPTGASWSSPKGRTTAARSATRCCSPAIRRCRARRRSRLRYRRPPGYRATDAALLPDGRILILNRRFRLLEGLSARLVVLDPARMAEGARSRGARSRALEAPLTVDNMEALSVTREGGRTIVWIASDDNFSPLQRTLLLKFELVE